MIIITGKYNVLSAIHLFHWHKLTGHYFFPFSDIDRLSPTPSIASVWPEDMVETNSPAPVQTYANVLSCSAAASANTPPPPLPQVGPNESPTKRAVAINNISRDMKEMTIDQSTQQEVKKLDPAFLLELEKHLEQQNSNRVPSQVVVNSSQAFTPPTPTQAFPPVIKNQPFAASGQIPSFPSVSKDNTEFPILKPPPQSTKPRSPQSERGYVSRPHSQVDYVAEVNNRVLNNPVEGGAAVTMQQSLVPLHVPSNGVMEPRMPNLLAQMVPLQPTKDPRPVSYQQGDTFASAVVSQEPSIVIPRPQSLASYPKAENFAASSCQEASSIALPRPVSGNLSEKVYAELRQTIPNLENLSQNEFNTLYNKTVQQNILRKNYGTVEEANASPTRPLSIACGNHVCCNQPPNVNFP